MIKIEGKLSSRLPLLSYHLFEKLVNTPERSIMSYTGKCHCGHHEWTVELNNEQQNHILCHCDTCKVCSAHTSQHHPFDTKLPQILGGGAFTMNQIIPKNQLKITKGGEPSKYTYYGDSGKGVNCYYCPKCTTHIYRK